MTLESCIAGCILMQCLRFAMSFSERDERQNISIRNVISRRMYVSFPPSLPPPSIHPVVQFKEQFFPWAIGTNSNAIYVSRRVRISVDSACLGSGDCL